MPEFRHRSRLPYSADAVFAWHMRPGALERLTPPWAQVRVLGRTAGIGDGGTVTLSVRQGPTSLKWVLRHTAFEEGRLFQDEQVSGPFEAWVHAHRFLPADDGGCVMEDHVEWLPPLGGAGRFLTEGLVHRELKRLFTFRHARLRHDMDLHARYAGDGARTVAVTGASGLLGNTLCQLLETGGHKVIRLSRRRREDAAFWDPEQGEIDAESLRGIGGVVHLAGEPIFGLRWTEEKKARILESRRKGTELLSRTVAGLSRKPAVLVSASAVGYYGDRGPAVITEESEPGTGFLAGVCKRWEEATAPAKRAGIRVVTLRTGMVLTARAGALGTMLLPFQIGLGGRLGSGRQYVSWIDLDDEVGLIYHALATAGVKGPLNATAPHPVPNSTFTDTLGRVLGRPTLIPVPALGIRALFGEMGQALLLDGARVVPKKAEATGFEFRYPSLEESLRFQLGKPEE
ncbi:MAG: TIGR01777 family oxidoreductase [Longimicrobiales bacterium]